MTRDKNGEKISVTWEDEEDPGDKCKDGAVRPDVANVVEDEADEHEEKADQRERSGWADHLWVEEQSCCLTPKHPADGFVHFSVKTEAEKWNLGMFCWFSQ